MSTLRMVYGMWAVAALFMAGAVLGLTSAAEASPDPGKVIGAVVTQDGKPVEGALVTLNQPAKPAIQKTKSGPDGKFEFPEVAPGEYLLKAMKPDVGVGGAIIKVASGKTTAAKIVIKMKMEPGKLGGQVVDSGGRPVHGATVAAGLSGMPFVKKAITDAEGKFLIEGLKPGEYHVKAGKKGVGKGEANAVVVAGLTALVKITLQPRPPEHGKIVGVVVDEDGAPVGMAGVLLGMPGTPFSKKAITDEKGHFAFDGLKPGGYGMKSFKKDVGKGFAQAKVEAGKTTEVKIVLKM